MVRIPFQRCPLCDGTDIPLLRTGDCSRHALYTPVIPATMTWLRCKSCGHVFTDGHFTEEAAAAIFSRTHAYQEPGADLERQRLVAARIVEQVAAYVHEGPWLDVGFGNGALLFTAAEWGFEPVGTDLRKASVETMARFGIEAHATDLTGVPGEARYSVVSLADVLEHMPFPRAGLASAHRLLRDGGILFVSMPAYDSPVWRYLDVHNANPYWGELEHYHNFSRERLNALLEEAGFTPLRYGVSQRYRACMEIIAEKADSRSRT